MKKRKVVLSELIDHLGEDRVLEILSEQETLKEQIDHFAKPIWETYFNVNLTAVILSFVIMKPSDIVNLALVCQLWRKATETKTIWREFLCKRFAYLPALLIQNFDPFHTEIWPKYKNLICCGVFTHKSAEELLLACVQFEQNCRCITYTTKLNVGNWITHGVLRRDFKHSCHQQKKCIVGRKVFFGQVGLSSTMEGVFCDICGDIVLEKPVKAQYIMDTIEGRAEFESIESENGFATGRFATPHYDLRGDFAFDAKRKFGRFLCGKLILPDGSVHTLNTGYDSFWKTFIRGLQKS